MSEQELNLNTGLDDGAEHTQATAVATEPKLGPRPLPAGQHWFWGTGRRKSAIARVRIRPGKGEFKVNGKQRTEFFSTVRDQTDAIAPLELAGAVNSIDVFCQVTGGGTTGQAGAIVMGLARALKNYDPSLEEKLRHAGMLTRDAREVERKKYGQAGARRRFQFSKR